jgi:sulfatase maturation enzyme AslB (radical SAM superfamily)
MWYDEEIELSKQGDGLFQLQASKKVMNAQDDADFDAKSWIDEKINDVKYVYFAGGEPLIMDEHYYILQKLIDAGRTDVRIRYNTNLLKLHFKHYDLVEMWSKFDFVQVNASIDDIGARAEYIRAGTVWNDIENNLQRLQNTNVRLLIDCTTQLMNVLTLPKLYERLKELGVPGNRIMLHNILQQPESFNVKVLTPELKDKAKQQLFDYANSLPDKEKTIMLEQIKPLIEFMYTETHANRNSLRRQFRRKQTALDNLRKENFTDVFPHLEEWYNGIPV